MKKGEKEKEEEDKKEVEKEIRGPGGRAREEDGREWSGEALKINLVSTRSSSFLIRRRE